MKIAVLGAGNVGGALGAAWAGKGHEVIFGVRDPGSAKAQAAAQRAGGRARLDGVPNAVRAAEVVVLALPYPAVEATLRDLDGLAGKVVLDATNPLTPDFNGLSVGHDTSGGEQVARWAAGARVEGVQRHRRRQHGRPSVRRPRDYDVLRRR